MAHVPDFKLLQAIHLRKNHHKQDISAMRAAFISATQQKRIASVAEKIGKTPTAIAKALMSDQVGTNTAKRTQATAWFGKLKSAQPPPPKSSAQTTTPAILGARNSEVLQSSI